MFLLLIAMVAGYSIKDKFCGDDNCYQLLFLTRSATQQEIRKQFRELSRIHHPDKVENDTNYYVKIVQAYEVLNNEETRIAYNEYIDNPNRSEFYYHYQYYKNVYHPQSNPIIVVSFAIILLSIIQYVARIGMYNNAINRVMETTHFKKVINERLQDSKLSREEITQQALKEVKISGAWSYPTIKEIWIIAIINYIFKICYRIYFEFKWRLYYKNGINELNQQDQIYKTKLLLDISDSRWESIDSIDLLNKQLWIKENMIKFEEEQRQRQQEYIQQHSNKYKQYKRFQKKQQ